MYLLRKFGSASSRKRESLNFPRFDYSTFPLARPPPPWLLELIRQHEKTVNDSSDVTIEQEARKSERNLRDLQKLRDDKIKLEQEQQEEEEVNKEKETALNAIVVEEKKQSRYEELYGAKRFSFGNALMEFAKQMGMIEER